MESILQLNKNENKKIRSASIGVLGALSVFIPADKTEAFAERIIESCSDPESEVRESAALALGDFINWVCNDTRLKIINKLLTMTGDSAFEVRRPAAYSLSNIKTIDDKIRNAVFARISELFYTNINI